MKRLFDLEHVSIGISGDYNEVASAFKRGNKFNPKKEILTIFDLYNEVLTTWAGYKEDRNAPHWMMKIF